MPGDAESRPRVRETDAGICALSLLETQVAVLPPPDEAGKGIC